MQHDTAARPPEATPTKDSPMTDVLVIGGGPAGVALATELAVRGLQVRLVAPHPPQRFAPTYGAWLDELPAWARACTADVWADVRAYTGPKATALTRPYALLDNAALLNSMLARAGKRLTWTQGTVIRADSRPSPGALLLAHGTAGERWPARVIVDAGGHGGTLTRPTHPGGAALQTAYGITATFAHPPSAPGAMVWMDWRQPPSVSLDAAPTFLYAMHLGGQRYFVQETSLVARPGLTRTELEARLHARLNAAGTPPSNIEFTEWVAFPMNTAAPEPGPVLAFGAAGGLVHPVSGFQVSGALADAPRVAQAIANALPDAEAATRAAWHALWPPERRAARELGLMGLDALLRLPADGLPAFFHSFFRLSAVHWHAFLAPRTPTPTLARTMLRVFAHAPNSVRLRLVEAAVAASGVSLRALGSVLSQPSINMALTFSPTGLHAHASGSGMTQPEQSQREDQHEIVEDGMQGATGSADANGLDPNVDREEKLAELRENLADMTHDEGQKLEEAKTEIASE
ncbi:lycopene cyclase family protein [Deinococcus sp. QL22]|uniref:lycopene cyclase family protein n=1 Tax=Deinococcus sp. QL22 TaxID=2939437 RepID=UPI002017EAD0|nr:lycopene cyclase family protein [Deinococcus sp. QL22]UQN05660.1 lycopene cyclase family protein [Deinococcus sp. QL22]